jgi:hypothetical protein
MEREYRSQTAILGKRAPFKARCVGAKVSLTTCLIHVSVR